nr:MAG TPA: hypothetical protein [Bacteriophage sp.]
MNGLAVKDIEFNGATLRAAQDAAGKIWVGIRWMCQGIGFNDGKVKTERKKIQDDLVLSQGKKFLPLGNDNANSEVLCLDLDYIPLWLAKIAITPTMQKENPDLVQKLITYQLKAKDVLAEAFLPKKEEIVPARSNMIQLQLPNLPDYNGNFQELNEKIDKLYSDIGKLANILLDKRENHPTPIDVPKSVNHENLLEVLEHSAITEWKKKIYSMIDRLIDAGKCKERSECLQYIYKYMNKNYGIVWDQEMKEYAIQNGKKPSTIDLTYNNETYRSIFESILVDLVENNTSQEEMVCMTDKIIAPLIAKYNDNSNAGCATYRLVYARMDKIKPICWNNREARYINKHEKKTATKKNIINDSKSLMKIFRAAVKQMLEEE